MIDPTKEIEKKPIENGDDDEPDEWDKRINRTGCAAENMKLTDCYWDTKDWRKCQEEMKEFQECWKKHGNAERTNIQP